jgi:hypothetical protein
MPIAYKVSHDSHPITNWADDRDNVRWLYALGLAYGDEIIYRTGRKHSSHLVLEGLDLNFGKFLKGKYEVKRFHNGARHMGLGIDYTHIENVQEAYRLYLNHRWPGDKRAPKWTKRRRPTWCEL